MWGTTEAAAARLLASGLVAICIVKHRLLLSSGWASSIDTTAGDTLASYWRPFEALLCRSLWMRPTAIKRPRDKHFSLTAYFHELEDCKRRRQFHLISSPKKPRRPPSFYSSSFLSVSQPQLESTAIRQLPNFSRLHCRMLMHFEAARLFL